MLFLVQGVVRETMYEGKTTERREMRLVEAESGDEASTKFDNYFTSRTDEYSVYYRTHSVEVFETIR